MTEIILTGIVSVVAAVLAFILQSVIRENHRLKKEKSESDKAMLDALRKGVRCLLRSKLMELHDTYVDAKTISSTEYDNWTRMYASYKALGGNGMITHMADDIEALKMDN